MLAYLGVALVLPKIALADVDWGIDINIGTTGGGLSNNPYGLPEGSIIGIVEGILMWILGILSAVSIIGFVIAGIMYLTAAGDETQVGKAKKAMTYSILGVIVGLSGFVILQAVQLMLGGSSSF